MTRWWLTICRVVMFVVRKERRIKGFLRYPYNYSWVEVVSILRSCGFAVPPPDKGSHWRIALNVAENGAAITIPVHGGRVKRVYLRVLKNWLEAQMSAPGGEDE